MKHTVTATFKTNEAAELTLRELESCGFTDKQISVVLTDRTRGNSFNLDEATKVPEGIATGGIAGGIIGAVAAGLTSVGAIATGGAGLLASGPVIAALAGGGAGALTGGLIGSLVGLGIPEHEAKIYENEIKNGAVLIAVETDSKEREGTVKDVFRHQDAYNIAA